MKDFWLGFIGASALVSPVIGTLWYFDFKEAAIILSGCMVLSLFQGLYVLYNDYCYCYWNDDVTHLTVSVLGFKFCFSKYREVLKKASNE